eukprot:2155290-Pyramimonas_sp.AAC.1
MCPTPPQEFRTPDSGVVTMFLLGSPPSRAVHQQGTVSSKKLNCNSGGLKVELVQGTANLRPIAWWPHNGAGGLNRFAHSA